MNRLLALSAAPLLLLSSGAGAAPYSVVASGTIVEMEENGLSFDGSVAVGSPFSVSFDFDTDAPDADPGNEHSGVFWFMPPHAASVEFGNYVFESNAAGFYLSAESRSLLARWPIDSMDYFFNTAGFEASAYVIGDFESLTLTPIPEPSQAALLLGGLAGLARRARARPR